MAGRFNPNDYVEVQQRITRFWEENPDGRLEVDLLSPPENFDQVVFRARVYKHRDNPNPDATGIAAEQKGQGGMANSTSWHENGETSAIGRALANMGYATSNKDRPSREEMQKVQNHTPQPQKSVQQPRNKNGADPKQAAMASLHAKASELNIDHDTLRSLAIAIEKREQGRDITSLTEAPTQLLVFLRGQIKDNLDGLRREFPQAFERDADLNPTDEELGIDARAAF